jgi:class 3 adenylate cyclase/predicted ATPase
MEIRGISEGERKFITALFADIKGSMELIEGLDPEEARRIIDPALHLMMDAVHCYEGYVAQSMGDGIFALFGAPIAHEDHPQRALYAALRMQEEIRRYADRVQLEGGVPIDIRVGVNTGEVVVRSIRKDDLHTDYVPIGHSTSLAARMMSMARAGSILVSEHSHKLTEGYFQFQELGAAKVKGVREPIHIYEVLGVGSLRTRLQVAASRGLVRFVGRQDEMGRMKRALEMAKSGQGQILAVMGEPGVGKSRLFYEFKQIWQRECLVLETFSISHGKAYPYLPLIDLLKGYFQITPQDEEQKRREKVVGKVLTLDRSLENTLPYLFSLLGVSEPSSSLQQMDPQIRKRRTFEAIKRLLLRESLNQTLLIIFEDLHWLDSETEAFLDLLSEGVASAHILLLVSYRPGYQHSWVSKTYYSQLRLDPLGKEESREMLTALLGDGAGLYSLKQLILEKTEGNPFFMEEVVRTLVEERVLVEEGGSYRLERPLTELHIPTTVQGVLSSRIDRLGAGEKELLQTLAVIGREFSLSLLRRVVEQPEEELYRHLFHLQGGEFIYEQPAFPEPEYIFKHGLTQEVAYKSVLLERRRVLHERTAQAMEEVYRSRLEDYYSELAHHYSRSGNTAKAVEYLGLAGQQAAQRSAHTEAINHLTTALELLNTLPDTPERTQQELFLQTTLGSTLMATKGFGAPEVESTFTRARDLCRQLDETPQLFPVLLGLWVFYMGQADFQKGLEMAEQILRLAQSIQDPALLLDAHAALGATLFWLGEFASARVHTEQGIALYDPQQHRSHDFLLGDPGVVCLNIAARAMWMLGYPDQALKRGQEALTLAQELSHPFSLGHALAFTAGVHMWRRESQSTREQAEALIALSSEQGFPAWLAGGIILRAWVLTEQGQAEEGIEQMRQVLAASRAMGLGTNRPFILIFLAEGYGKVGQTEEGLTVLAEALDMVQKTGERFYETELYRIKGELLLAHSRENQAEAEACFNQAIDIARRQSAKSLELRAAMSLSRLWQKQGKREEARQLLAEIYGWFTEGFDTADLKEAKALLIELGD